MTDNNDTHGSLAQFFWDKFPAETAELLRVNESLPFCLRVHHEDRNVIIEATGLLKKAFGKDEIKITNNINSFFENNNSLIANALRSRPALTFRLTTKAIESGAALKFLDSLENKKIASAAVRNSPEACLALH